MRLKIIASIILALAGGAAMAVQARITGALKVHLEDSLLAATVTFGSGLVLMVIVTLATRENRRGVIRAVGGALHGKFPGVFLFSGILGAYAVFGQSVTVHLIGVALFSLVFIAGQMLASALLDTVGWVPGGPKKLGMIRVVGIATAFVGVLMALSLRLQTRPPINGATDSPEFAYGGNTHSPIELLLPLLVVFTAGVLQPAQMAMNGRVNASVERPAVVALFNYVSGVVALALLASPAIADGGLDRLPVAPGDWWYYTGGLFGAVVVMGGAILTRTLGSLHFTMGLVAGQVFASLIMDIILPTPGAVVGWQTVVGCLLTILALMLISVGRRKKS